MGRRFPTNRGVGGQAGHEHAVVDADDRGRRRAVPRSSRPSRSGCSARRGRRPGTSASRACRSAGASSRSSTTGIGRTSDAAATDADKVGYIDAQTKAIFGRSYAAEPDVLVRELAKDTAIQAADTLLLTVPNQLGVDYNAHAIESILKYVAPELGWR